MIICIYLQVGIVFRGEKPDPENLEKLEKLKEALQWLDLALGKHQFVAGDDVTIADHFTVATIANIDTHGEAYIPYPV